MASLDDLEAMLESNAQKYVKLERGNICNKITILVEKDDSNNPSVGWQLLDAVYTRLADIDHEEHMSEVERKARVIFEEDCLPCLKPFVELTYNDDGELAFLCDYIGMSMGPYDEEEEIEYCLREVMKKLAIELPKEVVIHVSNDDVSILRTIPATSGPAFRALDLEMTELLRADLMKMIGAQGGVHKPYGFFRFDPKLLEQNLVNCPSCGTIWKARTDNPVRCQMCQRPLSGSTKRLTHRGGMT